MEDAYMKQSRSMLVGLSLSSCLVFAACAPKQTEEVMVVPPSPAQALPVYETRETTEVQRNICGKLSAAKLSQLLGTNVGQPSVTMFESEGNPDFHECRYAKRDDLEVVLLYMAVAFKKETKTESFQFLWNMQIEDAQAVNGVGVEAYTKEQNGQPVLYILTEDAQYWLQMAETSLNNAQQREKLQEVAKVIVE